MSDSQPLLDRLFAALDWHALGAIYCDEGGDAFWSERREPTLRMGRIWAAALAKRLPRGGKSLYVGAGVAELPAMLHEIRATGRSVVACNLRAAECAVIATGLRAVGVSADELDVVPADVRTLLGGAAFDHLAMVSALTDPETWPVVSAVTYGRVPAVLLDVAAFERERSEILALVESLVGVLAVPAWITTTGDEVPWLMHVARAHGLSLDVDDDLLETAVVGDPIGFVRVKKA
ncbi:MAG: hypothetical protein HZB39_09035 [Planctomycetes bacterium]|nr:hypothetical protein [Planctomycetota bacterium]